MLYSDLIAVKKLLDIPPNTTGEDAKLNLLLELASRWIEEILGRQSLELKSRTEYYQGTGTQRLNLNARPVWQSGITVTIDQSTGNFGFASGGGFTADALTFGTDYTIQADQDDGSSRCGILVRIGDYWPKPYVRQRGLLSPFIGPDNGSVKVTYFGGYSVDNLPQVIRGACELLVAKLYYVFPLGMEIGSESYEERAISFGAPHKGYLLNMIKPMLIHYRNWKW